MTPADLAPFARREVETRELRYPALVDQGRLDRGAALADIDAWRRIAAWLETGEVPLGRSGTASPKQIWTPLREAAHEALKRGDRALAKAPHDPATARRRDAIAAIHALLDRIADAFEGPREAVAAA